MKIRFRAVALLALLLVMGACAKRDKSTTEELVARVGSRPVTRSYYETRLERMDRQFLPDTLDLAGKRKFLQFITNKELMALKAEELGYGDEARIREGLEIIETNMVHQKAIEAVVAGRDSVLEEEIENFYEKKQNPVLTKHILVRTRREANEVYEQLKSGADFNELVDKYSIVPRVDADGATISVGNRAIFGEVEYGQAQPWVEEALFTTPLNQPTEPIQTTYGWHIFMPISTKSKRILPLSEQHDTIKQQIQLRKRRKLVNDYYDNLLKERGFELEETTVDFVLEKLPPDVGPDQAPDPATEIKPVIPFTIAERTQMLFMLGGKKYTVGDFSDKYDEISFFERPKRVNGAMGIYFWIRDEWLKPLQVEAARKAGIDKLPEIVNEVAMRREQMMVNFLHNALVSGQIPQPTEEQVVAFYEKHRATYVDPEMRVCNVIFHPREQIVRRAYDEIVGGADFVDTAIRYSETATQPSDIQTPAFAKRDKQFAELIPSAFSLKLKEYGEPFKTSQGWILLQLQTIIPEKPLQLDDIREYVVRDIGNEWSENKLNELLKQWEQEYQVQVFDDVLAAAEVRRDDVVVPGRPEPVESPSAAGDQTE